MKAPAASCPRQATRPGFIIAIEVRGSSITLLSGTVFGTSAALSIGRLKSPTGPGGASALYLSQADPEIRTFQNQIKTPRSVGWRTASASLSHSKAISR